MTTYMRSFFLYIQDEIYIMTHILSCLNCSFKYMVRD